MKGALHDLALEICTALFRETKERSRPACLDSGLVMKWGDLKSPAEANEVVNCALEMGWLREIPDGIVLSASGVYVAKRKLGLET